MNIFEVARDKWLKEGVVLLPPEARASVISCFEKIGVQPSEDIISLYSVIGGMEDMDDELFRLWPLDEIIKENLDPESEDAIKTYGVLFGDYLINSCCYRIKPKPNHESAVYIDYFTNEISPELRGGTLKEFFQLMQLNPDEALL